VSITADRKRRASTLLATHLVNPLVKRAVDAGIAPPMVAVLETTGRKSGLPRRTPVGNGLDRDTFWIVAEHGRRAAYVRNVEANSRVRIKVGDRWRAGTANLLPDDDPRERQRRIGRRLNALVVRAMGTDLLTVRVDLDPLPSEQESRPSVLSERVADGLAAGAVAAVLSGAPSTAYAFAAGRAPLEAALAAGTLLLPRERRPGRLLLAAAPVHLALSFGWAVALSLVLPRRGALAAAAVGGLGIAALDLGVVGRRFPRIACLPQAPQVADHLAFGLVVGAIVARRRARRGLTPVGRPSARCRLTSHRP
jgi:deazaflavin-dependent oxidoreductase (nitroreductase family)